MSGACLISVCRIWSSFNFLSILVFEAKFQWTGSQSFFFWSLVDETVTTAAIQRENSALALAITLVLSLLFRQQSISDYRVCMRLMLVVGLRLMGNAAATAWEEVTQVTNFKLAVLLSLYHGQNSRCSSVMYLTCTRAISRNP